jgi:hypothetical protein
LPRNINEERREKERKKGRKYILRDEREGNESERIKKVKLSLYLINLALCHEYIWGSGGIAPPKRENKGKKEMKRGRKREISFDIKWIT